MFTGVFLYLLTCARCWGPFAICWSCFRGHRYCGVRCSIAARMESRRASSRLHQSSKQGRRDHADHQAAYRQRMATRCEIVTDQSSPARVGLPTLPESSSPGAMESAAMAAEPPPGLASGGPSVCMLCGRPGPFIDFPGGGKRDRYRDRHPHPATPPRGALAGGNHRCWLHDTELSGYVGCRVAQYVARGHVPCA